jgi:integrase
MNIKRNISFSIEKRGTKTSNVPIRLTLTYSGNRITFYSGHRIDVNKWDSAKQKVKNGCFNKQRLSSAQINTALSNQETLLQEIFKKYEYDGIIPDKETIKAEFNNVLHPATEKIERPKENNFWDYFDLFIKERGKQNNWTKATYTKFSAVRGHLFDFNNNLSFDMLDETGLNDYVDFLRVKREHRNSTIGKQIDFLKWFLKWATGKGYNLNNTYATFKPKLKNTQKKVIFLNRDELRQLKAYRIPVRKNYLEKVRDVFLFCCYTGLRYSDAFNLKKHDIKDDSINITTVKTADSLVIELNEHSKKILDKYKDIPFEGNKALPVICNQKMNSYLKELCKMASINEKVRLTHYIGNQRIDEVQPKYELIGTHTGRRTFICNALGLGIPVQVVMKWTGHSDYKAMKPYIDVADDIKVSEMKKFDLLV